MIPRSRTELAMSTRSEERWANRSWAQRLGQVVTSAHQLPVRWHNDLLRSGLTESHVVGVAHLTDYQGLGVACHQRAFMHQHGSLADNTMDTK